MSRKKCIQARADLKYRIGRGVIPKYQRESMRKTKQPLRQRLWSKNPQCFWCDKVLKYEEATLEHLVRLCEGGHTNASNCVIACAPCNHNRGTETNKAKVVERAQRALRNQTERAKRQAELDADRRKPPLQPHDPRVDDLRRKFCDMIEQVEHENKRLGKLGHKKRKATNGS